VEVVRTSTMEAAFPHENTFLEQEPPTFLHENIFLEKRTINISLGGEDKIEITDNFNRHGINPMIEIGK
jgi:hypothetical protein